MRTIAICNLKGGVAKTTTCVNLAANLAADHKRRVLVVDADSQANATSFLGGDREAVGMASLLQGRAIRESPLQLQTTNIEGVKLVSGSTELMDLDLTKAGEGAVDVNCLRKLRTMLEANPCHAEERSDEESPGKTGRSFAGSQDDKLEPILYGKPFAYCLIDCACEVVCWWPLPKAGMS